MILLLVVGVYIGAIGGIVASMAMRRWHAIMVRGVGSSSVIGGLMEARVTPTWSSAIAVAVAVERRLAQV